MFIFHKCEISYFFMAYQLTLKDYHFVKKALKLEEK